MVNTARLRAEKAVVTKAAIPMDVIRAANLPALEPTVAAVVTPVLTVTVIQAAVRATIAIMARGTAIVC